MAAMSLFTVACVQEPVPYEQGEPDASGCYGVYFPVQDATGAHTYDPSQDTEVVFTVARKNSAGAITVPVNYTESHEGIFKVGELKFEDGQPETTLKVTFPESGNGVDYKLSLSIDDPMYASKYFDGDTKVDFSVLRVEWQYFLNPKTGEKAKFTFNQGWWGEVHTGYVKYYDVDGVRTCVTETDPVETEEGPAYGFWGTGAEAGDRELTFTWYTKVFDANGDQAVWLPVTDVFENSSYDGAMVQAFDYYAYWTVLNPQAALQGVDFPTFAQKYSSSYPVSIYDGNGGFHFYIKYYYMMDIGGWGIDDYDVVLLADGFVRTDYSLAAASDYTVDGVAPISFKAGADVAEIQYVVVEGEANVLVKNEQIEAIAAGTAENVLTLDAADMTLDEEDNMLYGSVEVTCPSTGKYTVIAVSFDAEGNAKESASVVFDYVAADDDDYDVTFKVEVADTPARFAEEGHTIYNSFSFTVYGGNDLTDAKIGLYPTADIEKYGMDAVVADLRYEDEETTMSVLPDTLARINTTAGYTDIYTGLKDNTSYTVVVWGTNGMQTNVVTASYTTEKNPEVFKSLGQGQYTDDLFTTFYNVDNFTLDVEIQESEDNPGKYRVVNPYAAYPITQIGSADDSDYYLTIHAEDPDRVYLEGLQPLGFVFTSYGMPYVMSDAYYMMEYDEATTEDIDEAGVWGTLKDGVITFPANALLVTADALGGKLYYGNTNGAFKVVLPGYGEEEGGEEETPEEGTETASVNKDSVKNLDVAFELPMSVGHIVGAGIVPETRTVEATATVSANPVRKSSGRDIPARNLVEINF